MEKSKIKKINPPKKPKEEKTELELVNLYAEKIMNLHVRKYKQDTKTKDHLSFEKSSNKQLWMDTDFYFSVVFKSQKQKEQFLKRFSEIYNLNIAETENCIKIINGVSLAKSLNIEIVNESIGDFPSANLDLRSLILDNQ